jgi:hypothetical protein
MHPPWIERLTQRIADEHQQRQDQRQGKERGKAQPRRLQVLLALGHQLAQRRAARRHAEAEEIQRRKGSDRPGEHEGYVGQGGVHGVGQDMPQHHLAVRQPQRAGRLDVLQVAPAQELGAHHIHQRQPRKQRHDPQQPPEIRLDEARG